MIQIFAQTRVGFDSLFSHHSRRIVGLSRHSRSAEISFSCHSLPWLMEWLRMKNDGRIWGCLSKIGGSSAAAVQSTARPAANVTRCGRHVRGVAGRVQWQRHFSLVDGIDGLSTDDHQLETIILRTNLLTAVHCCSGRVADRPADQPAS